MTPLTLAKTAHGGLIVLLVSLSAPSRVDAFDYAEARNKAVKVCEVIDPSESQSGLIFNPDGYRSFYTRSKCMQEAAITFRDRALCEQVRERRSLIASSWGYSAARCRQLVTEGAAADRAALEAIKRDYAGRGMKLRDFRVERNGNGRDIDIAPAFAGTYAGSYTLTFEIIPDASGRVVLWHQSGYHLDERSTLSLHVRQADIRQRFPPFALNRSYLVRATTSLDVGFGGQSGYWSPAFIESVFPAGERTESMTKRAAF